MNSVEARMFGTVLTHAISDEAMHVAHATLETKRRLRASQTFGGRVAMAELAQMWEECQHPNWDGYGALPVSWGSFCNASRLLESMPLGMPSPSVGAEPDGEITLEWYRSARRILSVSVAADEFLHYAALIGPNILNGTLAFFGDFPDELVTLAERVTDWT